VFWVFNTKVEEQDEDELADENGKSVVGQLLSRKIYSVSLGVL
jgi:hypothetical protein